MAELAAGRPRRLAILGASARAAALSAATARFDVATADLFADADLQQICPATRIENYPHGLADWLASAACDAWMFVGALENHPELVDRMATMRPLLGVSGTSLRSVRDPMRLQSTLTEHGLRFPLTEPSPSAATDSRQWLWKSCRGSSGVGVRTAQHRDREPIEGYRQRRIDGMPLSALFIGDGREATLYGASTQLVGEQWTGAASFQYCGSIAPLQSAQSVKRELGRIGNVLANAFELRGIFGVDLMLSDDELWLLEVNPRYTASAEACERAGGGSAIAAHVAGCRGNAATECHRNEAKPAVQTPTGKAILFAQRRLQIDAATSDALLQMAGDPRRAALADIPAAGVAIEPSQPVLTVLVDGPSHAAVLAQLQTQLDRVQALLYDNAAGAK